MARLKLAVLISGQGSNLQAMMDAILAQQLDAEIILVLSNHADAPGLARASAAGIPTQTIEKSAFAHRLDFDEALNQCLKQYAPDLIALAGFMHILSHTVVEQWQGKLINIHPSLLPKHRGLHTHAKALAAGDETHGVSIHFVSEALDDGPLIAQHVVRILKGDTVSDLQARVQAVEHRLYPQVLQWFAERRIELVDSQVHMDGIPLPSEGVRTDETPH